MDVKDIQMQCKSDSERWFPNPAAQTLPFHVLALCGESGELANKMKKIVRSGRTELTDEERFDLAEEACDVLIYTMSVFNALGVWGDEVYKYKQQKNEERFGANSVDQSSELSGDSGRESDPLDPSSFVEQSEVLGFLPEG